MQFTTNENRLEWNDVIHLSLITGSYLPRLLVLVSGRYGTRHQNRPAGQNTGLIYLRMYLRRVDDSKFK